MNAKKKVLLNLLGEIHEFCDKHGIVYQLAEENKTPYILAIKMDAKNLQKFIDSYDLDSEHRALEWMGTNGRYLGSSLKYNDLDTVYYTEDRLLGEINLGMYISIDTLKPSKSKWKKSERIWKYLRYVGSNKTGNALKSITGNIHRDLIKNSPGKLKRSDVELITIDGVSFYVRKDSPLIRTGENGFDELIREKPNVENFYCDETLSFRTVDLDEDRKHIRNVALGKAKLRYKKGEAIRVACANVSRASFYRYYMVTELLSKYSYSEIIEHADEEPVKPILAKYLQEAKKLHDKGRSLYIGEEFTKVINTLFPDVDTDELYKFTPDLYKEGIRLCDYKGNLIKVYGGANE